MFVRHSLALEIAGSFCLLASGLSGAFAAEPNKTKTVKAGEISLAIPEAWRQTDASNKFRLAQFAVPKVNGDADGGEYVVYYFEGAGGGIDDNIRRWVNQFRSKDRKLKITSGKCPHGDYVLVDLSGTWMKPVGPPIQQKTVETPHSRALSAILTVKDHGNYFLRLTGPQKTVSANADSFRAVIGADAKAEKVFKFAEE